MVYASIFFIIPITQDRYHVKQIINRPKLQNERTSKPEGIIALGLLKSIVERYKGKLMTNWLHEVLSLACSVTTRGLIHDSTNQKSGALLQTGLWSSAMLRFPSVCSRQTNMNSACKCMHGKLADHLRHAYEINEYPFLREPHESTA